MQYNTMQCNARQDKARDDGYRVQREKNEMKKGA